MDTLQQTLNPILDFFHTEGAAGGFIGAFLVLSASLFDVDVRLPIKEASWGRKILFLFAGTLVGALFFRAQGADMFKCTALGAVWPYVVTTFGSVAEAYLKGKEVMDQERRQGGNS